MRRIIAFCVLLTFAAISMNCSKSDQQGNAPNDNATGTTTYSNSNAPATSAPATSAPATSAPATTAAPSRGGASSNSGAGGGAAPKSSPSAPGIKPPTD